MREGESLVGPGSVGQALRVQLAGGQHDLAVLTVDDVAVVVDRDEVVVGPDLLDLAEGVEERLVVPQADVSDRVRVPLDVVPRQQRVAGELPVLHRVERIRLPGRGDVPRDEGGLFDLLVGGHDELLQRGRVRAPRRRARRRRVPTAGPIIHRRDVYACATHRPARDERHRDPGVQDRKPCRDVDVGRTVDDPGRAQHDSGNFDQ